MEKPLTIAAVCGWAIGPEWFRDQVRRYFPNAEVRALYPRCAAGPDEAEKLLRACPAQLYLGYSLGSLWLLRHRAHIPATARKALLAPILAFARESDRGGKTSAAQLQYFIKTLRSAGDPALLLKNFYAACNIAIPATALRELPALPELVEGLEYLDRETAPGSAAGNFIAIIGDRDNLLDAQALKRHIPHIDIVPGAGHAPDILLERLAAILPRNWAASAG